MSKARPQRNKRCTSDWTGFTQILHPVTKHIVQGRCNIRQIMFVKAKVADWRKTHRSVQTFEEYAVNRLFIACFHVFINSLILCQIFESDRKYQM